MAAELYLGFAASRDYVTGAGAQELRAGRCCFGAGRQCFLTWRRFSCLLVVDYSPKKHCCVDVAYGTMRFLE